MGRPIPGDFTFDGMGGVAAGMRRAVFRADRRAVAPTRYGMFRRPGIGDWGDDYAQMEGVKDFFSKVGSTLKKPLVAVGKGVVNAAGAKVGLGPIFKDPVTGALVQGPPPAPNYTPFIIGGAGLAVVAAILLARR